MKTKMAITPRTLNPDGIINNGEVGVVESPGPTQAYIPSTALAGNQFRLLNTSNHDVTVSVESNAFKMELVDADPQDSLVVPPGSMFFGVTGWSIVHEAFQLFATVTSAVDGGTPGPGPEGDWLPKDDPTYTGLLSGEQADIDSLEVNGDLVVGDDDSQQTHIRDNRILMTGDMGGRKLTVSPYMLQAGGMYSFDIQSSIAAIDGTTVDLQATTTEYGEASFRLRSDRQMDITAKTLYITANDGRVNIEGWQGVSIKGGNLSNAPEMVLTDADIIFSQNPILSGELATAELDERALIAKNQVFDILNGFSASLQLKAQPRVTTDEPASSVADAQLITKAQAFEMIAEALAAHGIT